MTQRHRGFVVGSRSSQKDQKIWTVRVKDPHSQYNERKFVAISVRGGLELAQGLNVHFAIGTIDDQRGAKILRAVDVCLESPEDIQVNTSE